MEKVEWCWAHGEWGSGKLCGVTECRWDMHGLATVQTGCRWAFAQGGRSGLHQRRGGLADVQRGLDPPRAEAPWLGIDGVAFDHHQCVSGGSIRPQCFGWRIGYRSRIPQWHLLKRMFCWSVCVILIYSVLVSFLVQRIWTTFGAKTVTRYYTSQL